MSLFRKQKPAGPRVLERPRYGWAYRKWTPIFDALLASLGVLSCGYFVACLYWVVNAIAEMLHLV